MRRNELANAKQALIAKGVPPEVAERIALQQDAVRVPGNTQRLWSGVHAEAGSGKTASENRAINRAIAKRVRVSQR